MKTLRIVPFVLLSFSAFAANLNSLIASARELKGEFSAEALLRLAAVPKLETAARIEALELAFARAADAQEPYYRLAAGLRLQAAAGSTNKIHLQEMDALSLRLRAVEIMLPLDPARARRLFTSIPAIDVPHLKCEDFLVYDFGRFYEVLATLLQRGFRGADAGGPEPARLLERYAAVTSPFQVGPMARVIAASDLRNEDFAVVLAAFAKALGRIEADDRSFSAARLLGKDIQTLASECKRRQISPLALLENYRVYLVIHLSSARCADSEVTLSGPASAQAQNSSPADLQAADVLAFFNQNLRLEPLKPIEELESTPTRLEGVAVVPRFCQSAGCRRFADGYRSLFLGSSGQPALPAARETAEWGQRLRGTLQTVAEWKPEAGEAPESQFREKAAAYSELLGLASAGANRDLVLRSLLAFLENHPLRNTNRLEWFLPVNGLIGRTALDPAGLTSLAEELLKSADPIIAMFANLERAAPRPPDRILPLL